MDQKSYSFHAFIIIIYSFMNQFLVQMISGNSTLDADFFFFFGMVVQL